MDLSEFLLARIADDEAVATNRGQLAGDQWSALEPDRDDDVSVDVVGRGRGVVVNALHWEAEHIARWDPSRVLAECDARRRIVEQYADYLSAVRAYRSPRWSDAMNEQDKQNARQAEARHRVAEEVAQLLALPYADHPDYDETWRP